ncbi:MAG: hypothetical protein U1E65_10485 [Myxococcota bacterium]
MVTRSSATALFSLLLVASAGIASFAEAAPEPKAKPKAAPGGGKEEFDRAVKLYQAEEYGQACPLFERAVELSGRRPSTLRALAQCERARKNTERAIAVFKEYLATKPSDVAQVEETIRVLERERAALSATPPIPGANSPEPAATPSPAPVASADPVKPPPAELSPRPSAPPESPATRTDLSAQASVHHGPRVAPWLVVGGGALVAGGGAVLLAIGKGDASKVENAAPGSAFADVKDAADRAPMMMTLGTVLIGVGAAGLSAGVAWLFLGEDS